MNEDATSATSSANRRIAGNTVMLFIRIFALTLVNLYAVRVLLTNLGAEDYGIFNAVMGVITASSFISGTLDIAFQRFYSYAMGKGDEQRLSEIFSASIAIVLVLSLVIIMTMEPLGLRFINNHMNIPDIRLHATNTGFHFALISFVITILQIPFTAVVFAHENMKLYTVMSTLDCILKLIAALCIGCTKTDNLVFYCIGLALSAGILLAIYWIQTRRLYAECKFSIAFDINILKHMLRFAGWTTYGTAARVGMIQGSTLLINVFYGPIANAAFAVALQINNAFGTLANCLVLALRPPMIKAYAMKDTEYLNLLFLISNKFIYYALLLVSVPLILEMDTILHLWLGNTVSDIMVSYSKIIIVYVIVLAINNPITIIMHATGNIGKYHFYVESIMLMCLPITWIMFRNGVPSICVLYCMTSITLVAHGVRLKFLKDEYASISMREYFCSFCIPSIVITVGVFFAALCMHSVVASPILRITVVSLLTFSIAGCLSIVIGLNRRERVQCLELIKNISFVKKWIH